MKVLVTGGAGFIGSHTVLELLEAGYETVVVDNLCNSSEESMRRVRELTGKDIAFYNIDVRDREKLEATLSNMAEALRIASVLLAPVMPTVSEKILSLLKFWIA